MRECAFFRKVMFLFMNFRKIRLRDDVTSCCSINEHETEGEGKIILFG